MDTTPLGNVNKFFPIMLVLLCIFNIFDVYSKIVSALGLSSLNFNDEY
jgi:hypothetical protein